MFRLQLRSRAFHTASCQRCYPNVFADNEYGPHFTVITYEKDLISPEAIWAARRSVTPQKLACVASSRTVRIRHPPASHAADTQTESRNSVYIVYADNATDTDFKQI